MDDYLLDDVVVQAKTKAKGKKGGGGGGGKTKTGARGGGKNRTKREAKQNKQISCYTTKHARIQSEKAAKQAEK